MTTKTEWKYFIAGAVVGAGALYIFRRQVSGIFAGIERVDPNGVAAYRAALFGR